MNKFRTLLAEGRKLTQAAMGTSSPLLAEMLGKVGFESVLLDFQHGAMDLNDVYAMLVALSTTQATPMVRVPWNDPAIIMKVLDAGAFGVVCPMVGTRIEAERFVAACRYPPEGCRSLGPTRVGIGRMGEYVGSANREVLTIAQIETVEGFENLGAIVSTPGLDALFPGPADLAMAYGESPKLDYRQPKMAARLRHIIDVAHAAGVKVTLPVGDAQSAEEVFRWGIDWVSVGPEWVWVLSGGQRALEEMRSAIVAAASTAK